MMRRCVAAVAMVVAWSACLAQAEPLNLAQVPADAKWIVHIDVDVMRLSTVVQRAYAKEISSWKDVQNRVAAIRDLMCMDPNTDLHGVTLYGRTPGTPEGAMLIHAAVDRKQFVEKVSKAPGYRTADYGPHKLYAWTQADGAASSAFHTPTLLILAKTDDEVKSALDVLAGKSASLAGQSSPLCGEAPAGTILLLRAISLADAKLPLKSPLVTQSDALEIALGEHRGESFSQAQLVTKSAEVAEQVRVIIEGIRATLQLQFGDNPNAMRVVKGLKVSTNNRTINIVNRASADDLWGWIEQTLGRSSAESTK